MCDVSEQVEVEVASLLCDSPGRHRTFRLPDILSERLDEIIARVRRSGVVATRSEIIGGFLLELGPDPERIEQLARAYRSAHVSDSLLEATPARTVLVDAPAPGPRPRRRFKR
jgi:hypothetical protein